MKNKYSYSEMNIFKIFEYSETPKVRENQQNNHTPHIIRSNPKK